MRANLAERIAWNCLFQGRQSKAIDTVDRYLSLEGISQVTRTSLLTAKSLALGIGNDREPCLRTMAQLIDSKESRQLASFLKIEGIDMGIK